MVRPRVEKLEEYRNLNEDDRKAAFDKHMRRLREKEEELEQERSRRDRRHRDVRNGGDSHRHRGGTPGEPDAYEAERKKAQAVRERQWSRRESTGLSPPPPGRGFRDREDDRYAGSNRQGPSSHYERERREREMERERSYISRADPQEKSLDLDYGDSRPSSMARRRRDSDGDSSIGKPPNKVSHVS